MQTFNLDTLKPIFDFELFKVKPQDKEDVKQTAILRILESLKNYTSEELPENKFFSFSQVIVKRTVVDYYRRSSRKIEKNTTYGVFSEGQDELDEAGDDTSAAPIFFKAVEEVSYEVSNIRADYEINSNKFTPQERKIIDFLLFNENGSGMNMAEISAELGVNKSHATRALKKLREVCADRY